MPCKTGYRKEIDKTKSRRKVEMRHIETPAGQYWQELSNQLYMNPDSFNVLSSANQTLFSVGILKANVCNGGFTQYFCRDAADYFVEAIYGLMEMGATKNLRVAMRAKEIYFGTESMPRSEDARKSILSSAELSEDQSNEIAMLDENFLQLADELHERTAKFMEKHGLH